MAEDFAKRWDERYSSKEYAYGTSPNLFLKKHLPNYPIGKILFPAEGEGRNAVFAASLGWDTNAFDISVEGKFKALRLAGDQKVSINYVVGKLDELQYTKNEFDAIALIYAHFPASIKSEYHKKLKTFLKNGGILIFEAFSKNHLEYIRKDERIGGPKDIDTLFSIEEILEDFKDFTIIELNESEIELHEGSYHNGKGSVIRFVGIKP
ncbi:MAG: class I SAM-dependent methyltransferase [Bacteroidetes bacterium]|nr:class I SAM-dependent methyltransferase [Bacteroidota bacterium]